MTQRYTRADHVEASRRDLAERKRTGAVVGDYETHLSAAKRDRFAATPLGRSIMRRSAPKGPTRC
jgi:hypothetical protein